MDPLWQSFFSDPVTYVGYGFALVAALGMLIFLRGFLSGFAYLFTIDWHDEHMEHYRTRAIWGVGILIVLFIIWEIVRWFLTGLVSFFTGA